MQFFSFKVLAFSWLIYGILSCSQTKKIHSTQPVADITAIKFLGEYDIPYALSYKNTTVGGLSGIDYDVAKDRYYLVCDDRSAINPARFYTAKIFLSGKGIDSVAFTSVDKLLQPGGNPYPNNKQDPYNTPDPEAMRYDPVRQQLLWSSEGERILREADTILSDPAIRIIDLHGRFKDSFPIPLNFHMQAVEKGPRQNEVFEGMSFADNYKTLYVSVEEPLQEDGPRADTKENKAFTRILKFDVDSKKNISQYAYELAQVAYAAEPANAFKVNGVTDILALGADKLLVIERSFSMGRLANTIRIFLADLAGASDIKNIPSLKENIHFKAAGKKLLLNMDDLGIYTDNIEGVTFGPLLSNGHKTLLFISDNNFNPLEKTQILLFEVIE